MGSAPNRLLVPFDFGPWYLRNHASDALCHYGTLIGSHTSRIDWSHQQGPSTISSARNRVLIPSDFGTQYPRNCGYHALCHYITLIGSHTSLVDWYHRCAPLMTGSARNHVLVPCDFTTRYGYTGITRMRVSCLNWEWHRMRGMTGIASIAGCRSMD